MRSDAEKARRSRYQKSEKGLASIHKCSTKRRLLRKVFLDAVKLGEGCQDCGYDSSARALQFDHVPGRGKKRRSLANMASQSHSWSTILDEIAKCDVVCANCHLIRGDKRRHGALSDAVK